MNKNMIGYVLLGSLATLTSFAAAHPPSYLRAANKTAEERREPSFPRLSAQSVYVVNSVTGEAILEKQIDQRLPIASITKLMMAMVLLDAQLSLDQTVTISPAEIDHIKHTGSRLAIGTTLTRRELLLLSLMSSENRAAAALARSFPGGSRLFVELMNQKARSLGMTNTAFYDPTGLDPRNTSTARDLVKLVQASENYEPIRQFTTTRLSEVRTSSRHMLPYRNSNALVRQGKWDIRLQKTGYIQEAGHCLVMQTTIDAQPVIVVILSAGGGNARINDAYSLKNWLKERKPPFSS